MRREPGGTEIDYLGDKSPTPQDYPSMQVSLVERCYRTALHPLDWNIQRISLDTYTAKVVNSSALRE